MLYRNCKGCDKAFFATRTDALTCSPRCRQRYKRHCDKITAEAKAKAARALEKLCDEARRETSLVCIQCGIERDKGTKCEVCGFDNAPQRP